MQLVTGVIWLVQLHSHYFMGFGTPLTAVARWAPALGFSVGLDTLTTGMIAGRLIYHHQMQKKLGGMNTRPYLPIMTIFIESAALSLISKIIQISIPSNAITLNPLVIPLCVSQASLTGCIKTGIHLSLISFPRPFPQISSSSEKHLVSVHLEMQYKIHHIFLQYNSRAETLNPLLGPIGEALKHLRSKVLEATQRSAKMLWIPATWNQAPILSKVSGSQNYLDYF